MLHMEPIRTFKDVDQAADSGGVPVDFGNTDNASGNDLYFAACENADMKAHPKWIKARVSRNKHWLPSFGYKLIVFLIAMQIIVMLKMNHER